MGGDRFVSIDNIMVENRTCPAKLVFENFGATVEKRAIEN